MEFGWALGVSVSHGIQRSLGCLVGDGDPMEAFKERIGVIGHFFKGD